MQLRAGDGCLELCDALEHPDRSGAFVEHPRLGEERPRLFRAALGDQRARVVDEDLGFVERDDAQVSSGGEPEREVVDRLVVVALGSREDSREPLVLRRQVPRRAIREQGAAVRLASTAGLRPGSLAAPHARQVERGTGALSHSSLLPPSARA